VNVASDIPVTSKTVKVAVIPAETKTFKRLTEEEVEKHLQ